MQTYKDALHSSFFFSTAVCMWIVIWTIFDIFKITLLSQFSSEKLKHGWTLTTSQDTITHTIYFKTQKNIINKLVIWVIAAWLAVASLVASAFGSVG